MGGLQFVLTKANTLGDTNTMFTVVHGFYVGLMRGTLVCDSPSNERGEPTISYSEPIEEPITPATSGIIHQHLRL